METTAIRHSRLRQAPRIDFTPPSRGVHLLTAHMRLADCFTLMKPRVMVLAVFTALVGLIIAPTHLGPLLGSIAVFAIAAGAGAAGVLNMWYDADIDGVMARTAMRPIPRGRVSRTEALAIGLVLAGSAVAVLAMALNVKAAALLAFTILFYIVVYTVWLKRRTPQSIVIGGASGALPPVIGWTAATGEIGIEPLILFLIIFLWTPPHFWALSLNRSSEYARAGIPILPVVAGRGATTRQILVYSVLLLPTSALPWALGFAGPIYGATAIVCGAILVVLAIQLRRSAQDNRKGPQRLFVFSIVYLFVLFAALLSSKGSNSSSSALITPAPWAASGSAQAQYLSCRVRTASPSVAGRGEGCSMRYSVLALAFVSAAMLGGCSGGLLDPKGPIASAQRLLLINTTAIMLVVVIPVIVAVLAFAWWYRSSNPRASRSAELAYEGRIEFVTWSIPALTVILLGGVIWIGSHQLDPRAPIPAKTNPLRVDVVSLDWKWLFIYPDQGIASVNQLTIPAETPVKFRLTSATVMNSFFVPQLGSQIYTMGGMTTHLNLLASEPGEFPGISANFSGDGFPRMRFIVKAVPASDFEAWVKQVRGTGSALDEPGFDELAKPGTVAPTIYRSVTPKLFERILQQTATGPARSAAVGAVWCPPAQEGR